MEEAVGVEGAVEGSTTISAEDTVTVNVVPTVLVTPVGDIDLNCT